MTILFALLALVLIVIGALGSVFPILPGLPLMFVGYWWLAYLDGFTRMSLVSVIVVGVIAGIGSVIDYLATAYGAKLTGSGRKGIWLSMLGSIVGLLVASILGMVIGLVLGAMLGEILDRKDLYNAGKVGLGAFLGFAVGLVIRVIFSILILIYAVIQTIKMIASGVEGMEINWVWVQTLIVSLWKLVGGG